MSTPNSKQPKCLSISEWRNKLWFIHTVDRQKMTIDMCNNMCDSQIIAMNKRSQANKGMYWMFVVQISRKCKLNCSDGRQRWETDKQLPGRRRNGKDARKLLWVLYSFIILIILVISSQVWNVSNAHKTCQIAHLKHIQFALCQLYLNKAIKILWRWSFCVLWEGEN